MKRILPVALLPALLAVSCIAGFDKTVSDFTKGPLPFRLEARSIEVPAEFLSTAGGGCEVASIGCQDTPCPAETTLCSALGVCLLEPRAVLSQEVDISYAYAPGSVRVDSVQIHGLEGSIVASDLNFDLEEVRILWAPVEAPWGADAVLIGTAGPAQAGASPGAVQIVVDEAGMSALEGWLETEPTFRIFVEFVAVLDPGHPCPEGVLDLDLSMSFRLVGEPLA